MVNEPRAMKNYNLYNCSLASNSDRFSVQLLGPGQILGVFFVSSIDKGVLSLNQGFLEIKSTQPNQDVKAQVQLVYPADEEALFDLNTFCAGSEVPNGNKSLTLAQPQGGEVRRSVAVNNFITQNGSGHALLRMAKLQADSQIVLASQEDLLSDAAPRFFDHEVKIRFVDAQNPKWELKEDDGTFRYQLVDYILPDTFYDLSLRPNVFDATATLNSEFTVTIRTTKSELTVVASVTSGMMTLISARDTVVVLPGSTTPAVLALG